MTDVFAVVLVSLRVAAAASVLIVVPAVGVAYLLARGTFRGKDWLAALVGLPLVLPPTAVGFLLLSLLAADGPLGSRVLGIDLGILLTWKAAVLAAAVMAFPLVVRTARVAFEEVDPRLEAMARTLGYGRVRTFLVVTFPLARRGVLAGLVLGFTRALGEYGATVTVAGSIPGETQSLASAIFEEQVQSDGSRAPFLIGVALSLGLASILVSERLIRGRRAKGAAS